MSMRTFFLQRYRDKSGISGIGKIAEGVQFTSGKCVLAWLTEVKSIAIYDNLEELTAIHGHDGATRVIFHDQTLLTREEFMEIFNLQ